MSRRLSSRTGTVWTKLYSSKLKGETCRCLSQDSQPGKAADATHNGSSGRQKEPILRGLPEELAERADLERKTIRTPVGDLPLSPLMNPNFHESIMRHRLPKAPESSVYKKVKWRRQLDRNPWAHALASDIRLCPLTKVTLPRFFLQDMNMVSHPETGRPWYIPTSLASSRAETVTEQPLNMDGTADADRQLSSPATSALNKVDGPTASSNPSRRGRPAGSTAYMLARRDLFAAQVVKSGISPSGVINRHVSKGIQNLFAHTHSTNNLPFKTKSVVWREDMDSFVLELMRRRIVEDLVYFSKYGEDATRKSYVVRCETWDAVKDDKFNGQRGCVLWFGEDENGPGPRAIMDIPDVRWGRKIPVHNMQTLLGPEHIERLKEETALFGHGFLFMIIRSRTMDLQLKLWKLQGFLAHPPINAAGAAESNNELVREDKEMESIR